MREGRLAFDVYKKIKEGILSLAYPPGATLQERQIAEQFGVSRKQDSGLTLGLLVSSHFQPQPGAFLDFTE